MRIRRLTVTRYRGLEQLVLHPGPCTVLIGPSNTGKSTVLEALDLLLHDGVGRGRQPLSELDYYARDTQDGFEIEAVLADLPADLSADVIDHLEGWRDHDKAVVSEPGGDGVEPIIRVRVTGSSDFDLEHTFAKTESNGARFGIGLRRRVGWFYDGRSRDPARELAFYQGGALDRLFEKAELTEPVDTLRSALRGGADAFNSHRAVKPVLQQLGGDLWGWGLGHDKDHPIFEIGALSHRELLQTLRLAIPGADGVTIPLLRQGRGAQRLLLVIVLLRLSRKAGLEPIVALDEPEQALEPLRQAQLVEMLHDIPDSGGQLFLTTHSPDIIRGFTPEDVVILSEDRRPAKALRDMSSQAKQGYERRLDGPAARGLFAPIPLLVEGPSDVPVLQTFWAAMAKTGEVKSMNSLGIDLINCEGVGNQPQIARVLNESGKQVVVLAEQDRPDELATHRSEGYCAALIVHDPREGRQNLEESLATGAPLTALAAALKALAEDRGYDWTAQHGDLKARRNSLPEDAQAATEAATTIEEFLAAMPEPQARALVAKALAPKGKKTITPFEMKGARQGRVFAEALVKTAGVPHAFRAAFMELQAWIRAGCQPHGHEITLTAPVPVADPHSSSAASPQGSA
ncbi:ATP-dependent nuclease [Pseudonocardia sichuanensis]